jgi:hypothetical protein
LVQVGVTVGLGSTGVSVGEKLKVGVAVKVPGGVGDMVGLTVLVPSLVGDMVGEWVKLGVLL